MLSATMDGRERFDDEGRRRFRRLVGLSFAVHAGVLAFVAFGPNLASPPPGIPGVVTVDLVAAAPGPMPGPAAPAKPPSAPKPPAPEPKVEAPKPKPEPVPVKPPPPKQDKVVLPKEAAKTPEKVPPKPKPAQKPVDYDDFMKQLRESAGESRPEPVQTARAAPAPAAAPEEAPDAGGGGGGGGTVKVSPEVMAWIRDARIHVRKNWVRGPGFQGLVTTLLVELDEGGNVVGEPKVKQRSGNPFYDDSVVRAIQKASPLPRPPAAGEWTFVFPSEETS